MLKPPYILLLLILITGIWLRHLNILGSNVAFDFDQTEDQFYTYRLVFNHDPLIIGRAVYGDPKLHHGVFYYYYNFIPFLVSSGNFFASIYWNIFFNAFVAVILFVLARLLFKRILPALISAFIASFSFEIIKFSNWMTIDTVTIFLVPLFYLGLWAYYKNKNWGLVLSSVSLGLTIQSDLTFLYLIPITLIFWLIFRPKIPSLRLYLISLLAFTATISTLILTEIKLNFAGVKTLLQFSSFFGDAARLTMAERLHLFSEDFWINFASNLFPQRTDLGIFLGVAIILMALLQLFIQNNQDKKAIIFLFLYLFSPAITLLLGYHNQPWFLIGLPPAIILISGYAISKIKFMSAILIILLVIGINNFNIISSRPKAAHQLFDNIYDTTSYLANQLDVLEYTYKESQGKPFFINAVTYPLYYNGLWAYLYKFYGEKKYGFVPSWLGGVQLYPYNQLLKVNSVKELSFMIISETSRIPEVFRNKGRAWAEENGKVTEKKEFPGFTIYKIEPR